jgi:hypothetical protein
MESFELFFEGNKENREKKKAYERSVGRKEHQQNRREWLDQAQQGETPDSTKYQSTYRFYAKNRNDMLNKAVQRDEEKRKAFYAVLAKRNPEAVDSIKQEVKNKTADKIGFNKKLDMSNYVKRLTYRGVTIYLDKTLDLYKLTNLSPSEFDIKLRLTAARFYKHIRSLLPNRKVSVIITNTLESEYKSHGHAYFDRIFIDYRDFAKAPLWAHEYFHILTDRVPRQVKVYMRNQYLQMLETYSKTSKTRKFPKDHRMTPENDPAWKIRASVAKKMGLPDPNAAKDEDELFAEIIRYWDKLPYKYKSLIKPILNRL